MKQVKNIVFVASLLLCAVAARSQTVTFNLNTSYFTNGVNVTLADNYFEVMQNPNVTYQSVTFTNTDSPVTVTPPVTNGLFRIKNTSPTNTPNYIAIGASTSTNSFLIYPGEVAQGRLIGATLHGSSSNGTQSAAILWLPN